MDALYLSPFHRRPSLQRSRSPVVLTLVLLLLLASSPSLAAGTGTAAEKGTGKVDDRVSAYDADLARREYPRATSAEATLVKLINEAREEAGLERVRRNEDLDRVAAAHAREMAALRYFSHISPRTGSAGQRVGAAGYTFSYLGENLAGHTDVKDAHRMMLESPSHRGNILRPGPVEAGIAVIRGGDYGLMIVELFLVPDDDPGEEPEDGREDAPRSPDPSEGILASRPADGSSDANQTE